MQSGRQHGVAWRGVESGQVDLDPHYRSNCIVSSSQGSNEAQFSLLSSLAREPKYEWKLLGQVAVQGAHALQQRQVVRHVAVQHVTTVTERRGERPLIFTAMSCNIHNIH